MAFKRETKFQVTRFAVEDTDTPDDFRCVLVYIPNSDGYAALLESLMNMPATSSNWQGEQEDREDRAQRWQTATTMIDYGGCMDCSGVGDCIETDEGVQGAIADAIGSSDVIQNALTNVYNAANGQNALSAGARTGDLPSPEGCDLDQWFGGVTSLVDKMNADITDFLEQLAEAEIPIERFQLIVSAIPLVNELPADEALALLKNVIESLRTEYSGEYTTDYRDEVRCDLFCLSMETCTLTPEQIFQYFAGRLAWTIPEAIEDLVNFLVTGVWDGTQICDVFNILYLGSLWFNNTFHGILGLQPIALSLQLGFDEPSTDWILLCGCGSEFIHTFDFEVDDGGWSAHSLFGVYIPDVGWVATGNDLIWLYITIPDSGRVIKSVRFEVGTGDQILAQVGTPEPTLGFGVFSEPGASYTDTTTSVVGITGFGSAIDSLVCRVGNAGGSPPTGRLIRLTVRGEGSDPF